MTAFVPFTQATFRGGAKEAERSHQAANLLGSVVYRPAIYRRNDVAWLAACAWRTAAKAEDLTALKLAKRDCDSRLIGAAADLLVTLILQLHGNHPADGITSIPCGHSRRPDCFGRQLAQAVADRLGLPFRQVFADRFCTGVSHPKEFAKLPPLEQIADPFPSMIVIDDLATSGWHVEESLTALRRLGVSASAAVWISGAIA